MELSRPRKTRTGRPPSCKCTAYVHRGCFFGSHKYGRSAVSLPCCSQAHKVSRLRTAPSVLTRSPLSPFRVPSTLLLMNSLTVRPVFFSTVSPPFSLLRGLRRTRRGKKKVPGQVCPERPHTGRPQQRGGCPRHRSGIPHRPVAFSGRGRPGAVLAISGRPAGGIRFRRSGRCGSADGDAEARGRCSSASGLERQEERHVSSSRAQVRLKTCGCSRGVFHVWGVVGVAAGPGAARDVRVSMEGRCRCCTTPTPGSRVGCCPSPVAAIGATYIHECQNYCSHNRHTCSRPSSSLVYDRPFRPCFLFPSADTSTSKAT